MSQEKKREIRAPVREQGQIEEIALEKIDPFQDHPFQVRDDEDMEELMESIAQRGILTPAIVRKNGRGRYELVAGHRRLHACKRLGLATLTCEVREMSREEATIVMVESNFQRARILPSEKAFAYKMRLEAMKGQGKRTDLTSTPVGEKLEKTTSVKELGKQVGDSATQIQRYVRLTELVSPLLAMVDEGKLGMRTAVELSYLDVRLQKEVYNCIEMEQCAPTHAQSIRMRKKSEKGKLTPRAVQDTMAESKPNQKERVILREERLMQLLPKKLPVADREDYICAALEYYGRYLQRKNRQQER